jgi:Putative transposase
MLKYMLRPPLANSGVRKLEDGRVELRLKREMHDGTRAIAMSGVELVKRILAIVPPPRDHGVRYFGAFAPNSKLRSKLVSMPDRPVPEMRDDGGAEAARVAYLLSQWAPPPVEGPPLPEDSRARISASSAKSVGELGSRIG